MKNVIINIQDTSIKLNIFTNDLFLASYFRQYKEVNIFTKKCKYMKVYLTDVFYIVWYNMC